MLGIAPASPTSWDLGPRLHLRVGVGGTLNFMKESRRNSYGHHGSKRHELAQHVHSRGSHAFTHILLSTQLQPRGTKRQLERSAITEFGIEFVVSFEGT